MHKHLPGIVLASLTLACARPTAAPADPPLDTDGGEWALVDAARPPRDASAPLDGALASVDAAASSEDAGTPDGSRRRRDAGTTSTDASISIDAATTPPTPGCVGAGCTCVQARAMWAEDFELGDHSRWTSRGYGEPWGDGCQSTALSTQHPHAGALAQRSEIVCASSSPDGVHRGYGGLQWSGDSVVPDYTNSGTGMIAPHGIVTTFWTWLEAGYPFGGGRWMSLFTINPTCDYTQRVVTLGLDNEDGIVRAAHYWPEGTMRIEPGAPAFPRGRWVRLTVYVNLDEGVMHVWQDGQSVEHVTGIVRESHAMCQWHWGLYASGDNTDVVLYEDDKSVWKLEEAWTDFTREPWLGATQAVCAGG